MAGSAKKKVASHSDFAKTKSSIKAKQRAAPSNATNTSFKARSIVLPKQGNITHIEERKQQKLIDGKGRGIPELVAILRGVGQGDSKSDAIDSLAGLLAKMPDPVTTCLSILPVVLPSITANAASVRTALTRLMQVILRLVPVEALSSYTTTLTLWITSGMNHIWKEVREDAARLAELVIEALGPHIAHGWTIAPLSSTGATTSESQSNGQRIFDTLLTSLGVSHAAPSMGGSSTTASKSSTMNIQSDLTSSPLSKLRLLRSLDKLIGHQAGLLESEHRERRGREEFPTWIFRPCFENASDWEAFVANGQGSQCPAQSVAGSSNTASRTVVAPFVSRLALLEGSKGDDFAEVRSGHARAAVDGDMNRLISDAAGLLGGSRDQAGNATSHNPYLSLYSSMHPLLLHTFLDHAPSTFLGQGASLSATEAPIGLQLIDAVLCLTRTLSRATLRGSDETTAAKGPDREALSKLNSLLDRAALYFPFEARATGSLSANVKAVLKRLSASWCETVGIAQMLAGSPPSTPSQEARSQPSRRSDKQAMSSQSVKHLGNVQQYLSDLLVESAKTPALNVITSSDSDDKLSDSEYVSLLPTIWHLLSETTAASPTAEVLLSAFINHWSQSRPSSVIKQHGFTFLLRVCSLPHYRSLRSDVRRQLTRPSSEVRKVLRETFVRRNLGRALYEMSNAAVADSAGMDSAPLQLAEQCLALILDFLRYDAGLLDGGDDLAALWPSLTPFFWITAKGKEFPGPFKRLCAGGKGGRLSALSAALRSYLLVDDAGVRWGDAGDPASAEVSAPVHALLEGMRKAGS
ncbi:unnamed protein product [Parajaminaea phylloscopi]